MCKKRNYFCLVVIFLCLFFLCCNNATASNGKDGKDGVNGKDGASIVWKGAYSSADQIENPEYLL